MSNMSIKQLRELYSVRGEDIAIALCSTPGVQVKAQQHYDPVQAGRALAAYYRRKAENNLVRHEGRKKPESRFFMNKADDYMARAQAVENKCTQFAAGAAAN